VDLGTTDAGRAENDPGVGFLPTDGVLGEKDKMPSISGDEAAMFSRRVGQLLSV
jgi:hypothetical protein